MVPPSNWWLASSPLFFFFLILHPSSPTTVFFSARVVGTGGGGGLFLWYFCTFTAAGFLFCFLVFFFSVVVVVVFYAFAPFFAHHYRRYPFFFFLVCGPFFPALPMFPTPSRGWLQCGLPRRNCCWYIYLIHITIFAKFVDVDFTCFFFRHQLRPPLFSGLAPLLFLLFFLENFQRFPVLLDTETTCLVLSFLLFFVILFRAFCFFFLTMHHYRRLPWA